MSEATLPAAAWAQLAASITRWTGFHADAIWARAVQVALAPRLAAGMSADEVVARAERDDPALRRALTQAVPVGETYFFRGPQHFAFLRAALAPRWAAEPGVARAVWSAGCATGEEAWSLAATLRAAGVEQFQVIGTDLVEANVAAARAGRYGTWSLRGGVPAGEDPLLPAGAGGVREVDPALRARVAFEVHNLLDAPPPPGRFDLVLCRNVLIYMTPEAAARVVARLGEALAPGGVVAFATMDLDGAPPPLVRIGAPELQLFQRPPVTLATARASPALPPPAARASPAPARAAPAAAAPPAPAAGPRAPAPPRHAAEPEPVSLHLRALALIDGGDHAGARAVLGELLRLAPQYLPGMLEGALLHAREGRRGHAAELMRSVLARAGALPAEAPVPGPEVLPARFYAAAARTFLGAEVRR